MAGMKFQIATAASLLAGAALWASAAAAEKPVGSLCNASGKIEVFAEQSSTSCTDEPEKEMKALFKARSDYDDMFGLGAGKKAQIDARIERRIRELRKIKAARATADAGGKDALPASTR